MMPSTISLTNGTRLNHQAVGKRCKDSEDQPAIAETRINTAGHRPGVRLVAAGTIKQVCAVLFSLLSGPMIPCLRISGKRLTRQHSALHDLVPH